MSRRILLGTAVAHFLCEVLILAFPVFIPIVSEEMALDPKTVFWMYSLATMAFGWGALAAGSLIAWKGDTAVILVFLAGAGLACAGVAASPNAWLLGGALVLLGASASLYHPAGVNLVAGGVARRERGMGLHGMAGSTGAALGPAFAGVTADLLPGGWRASFVLLAFACAAGWLWCRRILPRERVVHDPKDSKAPAPVAKSALFALFALVVLAGLTYRALVSYLPLHFSKDAVLVAAADALPAIKRLSARPGASTVAGLITSLVLTAGIAGQWLGGALSEGRSLPRVIGLACLAAGMACWGLGLAAGWIGAVLAAATLGSYMVQQPALNSLVAALSPSHWRGTAYGLFYAIQFGIGGLGAGFAGQLHAARGPSWVFGATAVAFGLAAGLAFLLVGPTKGRREAGPRPASAGAGMDVRPRPSL